MIIPGVDHPLPDDDVQLVLVRSGIGLSARVETATAEVVVVRPSVGEWAGGAPAAVGDRLEVSWIGQQELRLLPAEVQEVRVVGRSGVPRWSLAVTGPAGESQRRAAVRARLRAEVRAQGPGGLELAGEVVDLSESGVCCALDGWGLPPYPGDPLTLSVELGDGAVDVRAEVLRVRARGPRWVAGLRFLGLSEREQDRLRRRVFRALREERARLAA